MPSKLESYGYFYNKGYHFRGVRETVFKLGELGAISRVSAFQSYHSEIYTYKRAAQYFSALTNGLVFLNHFTSTDGKSPQIHGNDGTPHFFPSSTLGNIDERVVSHAASHTFTYSKFTMWTRTGIFSATNMVLPPQHPIGQATSLQPFRAPSQLASADQIALDPLTRFSSSRWCDVTVRQLCALLHSFCVSFPLFPCRAMFGAKFYALAADSCPEKKSPRGLWGVARNVCSTFLEIFAGSMASRLVALNTYKSGDSKKAQVVHAASSLLLLNFLKPLFPVHICSTNSDLHIQSSQRSSSSNTLPSYKLIYFSSTRLKSQWHHQL